MLARPTTRGCWRPFARVGLVLGTGTLASSLGVPAVLAVLAALVVAVVLLVAGGAR